MPDLGPTLTFSLATAPRAASRTATAAIAIVDVWGDPADACRAINIGSVSDVGTMRLAQLSGIDEALVCRVASGHLQIHTHAGPFVIEKLLSALRTAGAQLDESAARTSEERLNYWLAHAPSPRALDLLLAQPRLREAGGGSGADPRLDRLLLPPLVVAIGRPNVGKSSLLNALARRSVAIVSDAPGTTRDSVGALLELDGLAVRWLDLPGLRETDDPIEAEAIRRAREWAGIADLAIQCTDDSGQRAPLDTAGRSAVTVLTKADLHPGPPLPGVHACSAKTGTGIPELARAVRASLVPDDILTTDTHWNLPDPA